MIHYAMVFVVIVSTLRIFDRVLFYATSNELTDIHIYPFIVLFCSADGQGSYKFTVDDVTKFVTGGYYNCSESQEIPRLGLLGISGAEDDLGESPDSSVSIVLNFFSFLVTSLVCLCFL